MKLKGAFWILPLSLLALSPARAERLRLPDGTPVRLFLRAELSSARAHLGDRVDFEVADPIVVQGHILVPVGAAAWGAVQSVKEKEVKFDIEGARLPNLQIVKLRTVREKTKSARKDQIKVEARVSDGAGAAPGTEFTAYLDEDAEVDVPGPAATALGAKQPAAEPKPVPAEAKPATAAVVAAPAAGPKETAVVPNPSGEPRPATSAASPTATPQHAAPASPPVTETPEPAPPAAPAAPSPTRTAPTATLPSKPSAPVPAPLTLDWATATEWVTVECFSDPSGADILIDENFVGNTPSILKVPAGDHALGLKRNGYQPVSESMSLPAGSGLRTIRKTLQPKN